MTEQEKRAAHTPGPWRVRRHLNAGVNRVDTWEVCYGEIGECVAEFVAEEANARLIAAAPALLEASKAFLKDYVECANSGDWGNWDPEKEDEVIAMRAAIAQAEGREARE